MRQNFFERTIKAKKNRVLSFFQWFESVWTKKRDNSECGIVFYRIDPDAIYRTSDKETLLISTWCDASRPMGIGLEVSCFRGTVHSSIKFPLATTHPHSSSIQYHVAFLPQNAPAKRSSLFALQVLRKPNVLTEGNRENLEQTNSHAKSRGEPFGKAPSMTERKVWDWRRDDNLMMSHNRKSLQVLCQGLFTNQMAWLTW